MRRMIGFMTSNDPKSETPSVPSTIRSITPVKSLVKVRFECHSMPLAYYNDRFDLQEGDVVYVSGKLAGEPGVVVSVTTKFRIHTSDYERVLSLLDLTIHGSFTGVRDKMVSFDQIAITPEQFAGWVTPPEDPKKKKDEDERLDFCVASIKKNEI